MSRVFITGAAGFLGSYLAKRCLEQEDEVHALVRPGSSLHRLSAVRDKIVFHRFDLADRKSLENSFREVRPECVYHFAIRTRWREEKGLSDAIGSVRVELLNLLNLLAVAQATDPSPDVLIRAGSLAEYGPGPTPFRESQREEPIDTYSSVLVAGTHYSKMLRSRLSFPVITARFALLYGPGQSEQFFIPNLIQRSLSGLTTRVARPDDRRDLLYIDDAVDALLQLAQDPLRVPAVVNVSTGVAPKMSEVAEIILEATGVDRSLVHFEKNKVKGGIAELLGCPDLIHEQLGWQACVSLSEGVGHTVDWYRTLHA